MTRQTREQREIIAIVMAAAPAESSRRLRLLGSDKRLNLLRDKKTLPVTVTAPLVAVTSTVYD